MFVQLVTVCGDVGIVQVDEAEEVLIALCVLKWGTTADIYNNLAD